MTNAQARIIRQHYALNRPVTNAEVRAEIRNLRRRAIAGTLDNNQGYLAARLDISATVAERRAYHGLPTV